MRLINLFGWKRPLFLSVYTSFHLEFNEKHDTPHVNAQPLSTTRSSIIYYEKVMLKEVIYFTTVKIIVFYKFSLDQPLTLIYCLYSHINNYEFFCKILYTFKFIDWKKEHIDQLVTDPYNT